jgi:tetratricopeptide (TPR) repeat protein
MVNPIRQARDARGWTSTRLNYELRQAAARAGVSTASQTSLRVMISQWENDHQAPDRSYQMLLQLAFDLPAEALGFTAETPDDQLGDGIGSLVRRNVRQLEVSDSVLGYFRQQHAQHTLMDNIAGPGLVVDIASTQADQLRTLAERGPVEAMLLAARFQEMAGWMHQDSGSLDEALRRTDASVDLAERARDADLAAYNTMRKSNVLTEQGDNQRAVITARRAVRLAARHAPQQEAICLRQVALAEAQLRQERHARAAIDRALELASSTPVVHDFSAYCTTPYVQMEGALCLLTLGQPAAAARACTDALASWPPDRARDEALCLSRLAVAQLELRHVDAACDAALTAIERVQAAPSARTLHLLRVIARRVTPLNEARRVRELREALAVVA